MSNDSPPDFVEVPRPAGPPWRIARRRRDATREGREKPGYVWLGGFGSDMLGAKASCVDALAAAGGRAMLRFDYSGHGESAFETPGGRFEDGCVGDWLEQSLALFLGSTEGPQILIGSSMGAWIALLLARRLHQLSQQRRLHALALLAPAADFTEALVLKGLPEAARRELFEQGCYRPPSPHGAAFPFTRRLIEDGRNHLLLDGLVRSYAPVRILQGVKDEAVPVSHAMALVERLALDPVVVSLIADGDHRLSRPQDLALLGRTLEELG